MEKWKKIKCVDDDRYEVSTRGRLRSWAVHGGKEGAWDDKPRILSQYTHRSGHKIVGLRVDGQTKQKRVHRITAKAFIPNPHNYPHVLHKDDDPENNHVENLYWGNDKMNQADRRRNNGHHNEGEHHGLSKLTKKQVIEIKKRIYKTTDYFKDIAEDYGVSDRCIRAIKDGESWSHIKINEEKNNKSVPDRNENKKRSGHWNASTIIHKETGKKFQCIKDAAEWIDMNYGTLVGRLKRNSSKCRFYKE